MSPTDEASPRVQLSAVNRRLYLGLELEHAIECLRTGLERIAEGRTVLREDSVTLFLLANGLERYLKVAVHVLTHEKTGDFESSKRMREHYRHEIIRLGDSILDWDVPDVLQRNRQTRDDIFFARTDDLLRRLLTCLDAFAGKQRYHLLDGVSGSPVDPERNPRELWEKVLRGAADLYDYVDAPKVRPVVAARLIATMQRYLRCIAQVVQSLAGSWHLGAAMSAAFCLNDADLAIPCRR